MRIWIVEAGEPLPGIDSGFRPLRTGQLAETLVSRGHAVLWWSSTFNHEMKRHRFGSSRTVVPRPGLTIRMLHGPGYRRHASLSRLMHNRTTAKAFSREALKVQPPDVVLTCLPTPELAGAAVDYAVRRHIPVAIDVQDPWPEVYLAAIPHPLQGAVRIVLQPEFERVKRLLRRATAIAAVSEDYLRWALAESGRAQQPLDGVYHLGYPRSATHRIREVVAQSLRSKYGISASSVVFAFVGSFGLSYDLRTVVRAARILQNTGRSEVRVVLAGAGEQYAELVRMARGLGNIILTGWLDADSVLALLQCSRAGIAAYTLRSLQSMPYKPFEYMAAGLPVVSSLRGEFASIIERQGIGLQYLAGSPESLTAALVRLAENPESARTMGLRARQIFEERFDADLITNRLADALERAHAESPPAPPSGTLGLASSPDTG